MKKPPRFLGRLGRLENTADGRRRRRSRDADGAQTAFAGRSDNSRDGIFVTEGNILSFLSAAV